MKQFNTVTSMVYEGLSTSTTITGGVSTATFTSGAGLPVDIALSGTSLLFSKRRLVPLNAISATLQKSFKIFRTLGNYAAC